MREWVVRVRVRVWVSPSRPLRARQASERPGAPTSALRKRGSSRWELGSTRSLVAGAPPPPPSAGKGEENADAKDVKYQEGRVWRLEPAYNASVTLKTIQRDLGATAMPGWPVSWWVSLYTTPAVSQRPHGCVPGRDVADPPAYSKCSV